jgi:thioredoxin 1
MKKRTCFSLVFLSGLIVLISQGCEKATPEAVGRRMPLTPVSSETFENVVLKSDRPVLVDFWAPWCNPCLQLMPTMEELAAKYENQLVFVKINLDEEPELAEQYRVTSIPRLIYFRDGQVMIEDGGHSRAAIEKEIKAVLTLE